jgi:hypothetical protein
VIAKVPSLARGDDAGGMAMLAPCAGAAHARVQHRPGGGPVVVLDALGLYSSLMSYSSAPGKRSCDVMLL